MWQPRATSGRLGGRYVEGVISDNVMSLSEKNGKVMFLEILEILWEVLSFAQKLHQFLLEIIEYFVV